MSTTSNRYLTYPYSIYLFSINRYIVCTQDVRYVTRCFIIFRPLSDSDTLNTKTSPGNLKNLKIDLTKREG